MTTNSAFAALNHVRRSFRWLLFCGALLAGARGAHSAPPPERDPPKGSAESRGSDGAAGDAQNAENGAENGGAAGTSGAAGAVGAVPSAGAAGKPAPEPVAGAAGTGAAVVPTPKEAPHRVQGIRASSGLFRGAIAGGAVTLELNHALPYGATVRASLVPDDSNRKKQRDAATPEPIDLVIQGFPENDVVVAVPPETPEGRYQVELSMTPEPSQDGAAITERLVPHPQSVSIRSKSFLAGLALVPLGLLVALLVVVFAYRKATSGNAPRPSLVALLLLDPENETYSLSRAQFIAWLLALGWAYVFLFVAQGFVQNVWTFPSLEGFGATFLLSLGTLVAAQATSTAKGPKGAGQYHPSLADLFLHGGVLALERVQQVLWTLIAVGMFLYIVFRNYAEAAQLPEIPEELLVLMGVSSAGYIAGKLARKAGPVVHDVTPIPSAPGAPQGLTLKLVGTKFSRNASVQVDGNEVASVAVLDPPSAGEFATKLEVPWSAAAPSLDAWYATERRVEVINADSQRAEWRSTPKLEAVTANRAGAVVELVVDAWYVPDGAEWTVTGAELDGVARERGSRFRLKLKPARTQGSGTVSVETTSTERVTLGWTAP